MRVKISAAGMLNYLSNAVQNDDQELANRVIEAISRNHIIFPEKQLNELLFQAVLNNSGWMVNKIIDLGANVNSGHFVHISLSDNNLSAASALIERGANIDDRDKDGQTPLFVAVQQDNIFFVKKLLKKG